MIVKLVAYTSFRYTNQESVNEMEDILSLLNEEVFVSGIRLDDESVKSPVVDLAKQKGYLWKCIEDEARRSKRVLESFVEHHGAEAQVRIDMDRVLGSVHFISGDKRHDLAVYYDDHLFRMVAGAKQFGNKITISFSIRKNAKASDRLGRDVCARVFGSGLFDYGYCCDSGEFREKNLQVVGGGMRAVGMDISSTLPGFYWGNYFGASLIEKLAMLNSSFDGFEQKRWSHGLLLVASRPVWCWKDKVALEEANAAKDKIGNEFFYGGNSANKEDLFAQMKDRGL